MKQDEVVEGGEYLTKVGESLVRVKVVQRVQHAGFGRYRSYVAFRVVRVDNGKPLPKERSAAALHPLPKLSLSLEEQREAAGLCVTCGDPLPDDCIFRECGKHGRDAFVDKVIAIASS